MKQIISDFIHGKKKPASWNQLFHHLTEQGFETAGECCCADNQKRIFVDGIGKDLAAAMTALVNGDVITIRRVPDPIENGVFPTVICRGKKAINSKGSE